MKNFIKFFGIIVLAAIIGFSFAACDDPDDNDDKDDGGGGGIEMVQIRAGSFNREGSTITLSAFRMGKYEVTQEQYEAVMGTNPSYYGERIGSGLRRGEVQGKRPVESVSWYDAIVFCNRLSIQEGLTPAYSISGSTNPDTWGTVPTDSDATWNAVQIVAGSTGYRLPTEAQWEYACRAGTTTNYYWGNQEDETTVGKNAWYDRNSSGSTREVGTRLPNAWGLYDMIGNVSEWCWDWYDSYPSGNQTNPVGPSEDTKSKVARGGLYGYSMNVVGLLRSAFRGYHDPYGRARDRGFRVLRPF